MFREMRRYGQQLADAECEDILAKQPRGVLSLCGDGGYPYGIPMDFVYIKGRLYFHCAKEGHKIDALERSDKVSFCVFDEGVQKEDWSLYFNSVVVFGRMSIVSDDRKIPILRELGRKYYPDDESVENEIAKNGSKAYVLELIPEHITGKRVHEK